jgi:hypothetical protein
VLLVGGDHEPARVVMGAGPQVDQLAVGVGEHVADPVALRVERGAQAAGGLRGGQRDREVRAAAAAVGDPFHVAVVGVEGDGAADAVDQRLRVPVGVVGPRDAVVVVGHPRDRGVVRAERRAGEQQPEAGALERRLRAAAPRGELAHVVGLVGDQQGRQLRAPAAVDAGPGGERRVGDRDAVAVPGLGAGGVGPVGLEVDPVTGRVGRPLAADVGGGGDDGDARHAARLEHPVRDAEAERGLAGGGRGGREERVGAVGLDGLQRLLLPGAERPGGGPGRERAGARRARWSGVRLVRHERREARCRSRRNRLANLG